MTDDLPASNPDDSVPKPPRRAFKGLFLLLVLVILVALVFLPRRTEHPAPVAPAPLAPAPVAAEPAAPPALATPAPDLTALETRLEEQEKRIAALEARAPAPAETPANPAPKPMEVLQMGQQIAQLQAALETLRAQSKAQGLPVRQLQLWVLLQQVAHGVAEGASVTLPVAQLQEAWVGTAPSELEALRSLARTAEQRIPTEEALLDDFVQLRNDVSTSLLQKEAGFWARITAMLRAQIRVRRLDASGESAPTDPLAALDEAQDALSAGALKDAIRRVEAIPQGKVAFESWLEAAQRRVEAEEALTVLQQGLLAQLTAKPGIGDTPSDDDAGAE